jgi:hypothetical protein
LLVNRQGRSAQLWLGILTIQFFRIFSGDHLDSGLLLRTFTGNVYSLDHRLTAQHQKSIREFSFVNPTATGHIKYTVQ